MTVELSGPHPDLVTLVPIWMSPEPGDNGTPIGLNLTWLLWSSTGPQRDLVNMLPTCATSGPGDSGSTLASSGHGYSIPTWSDLILVTLVLTLASSVQVTLAPPGPHL